jgi:hypothetical protein
LALAFPHPTLDIDVEQANNGRADNGNSDNYLILVPSSTVLGQAAAQKALAQDVAGLKHDFQLLYRLYQSTLPAAPPGPCLAPAGAVAPDDSARCFANNTVAFSVLDPRDAALQADALLPGYIGEVFPLNRSVTFLPRDSPIDFGRASTARAVEQYELYKQNQKQTQFLASLQSTPPAGSPTPAASPVTTTTTTVKTPVPPSSSGSTTGGGSSAPSSATTSISTSTSTTPAAGASPSGAATPAAGSTPSAAPAGASATPPPAQPVAPSWTIDNIVRLYDYRDAPGIAAAINGMVLYVPNSRPIVQALSDNGANDLIEILPSAAAQGGYTVGDIERAISLLDLPRPQLSLQVWSYQISAKVKNPVKPYKRFDVTAEEDDARTALKNVNQKVDQTNRNMTKALERGMETIYNAARANPDSFFDATFRGYLTQKYHECILRDRYCLGYYDALDYPDQVYPDQVPSNKVIGASLGHLLLFLAAASDTQANPLVNTIIGNMESELTSIPIYPCAQQQNGSFARFREQLDRVSQPGNLHILRAAFLDFFFNYKWTLNYPNDFIPYDLRHSAHALDDLLQPMDNAFNQDIDDYVQAQLDEDQCLIPRTRRAGLISQGMVSVAALSGTPATVSGQVSNYFNITQIPSLSQVAQNLLAGANNTAGPTGLQGLVSTNPYVVGGEALAGILAPPKLTAQLTRGITLTVTPTSLDTASAAELNVSLVVNEPDGAPQSVNSAAATQDLLDRVASHVVTDTVRVQSLKLFDLSTLSMQITHPQTPTCLPLEDDGFWRKVSYVAAVPFSVPCAVWRSAFGSVPVAGRLFEWPRPPITVDNRSVAIIRADVVPTAMDFGEALNFESDRVRDPVTGLTESLSSVSQLGWRTRQFHRLLMQCVVNSTPVGCPVTLSDVPEDVRKPTTN